MKKKIDTIPPNSTVFNICVAILVKQITSPFIVRTEQKKIKQETLRVVTIAMISSTLASLWKFSKSLYVTQLNIYDVAFIAKIVSRYVYSQKSSIVDTRLGSKYKF